MMKPIYIGTRARTSDGVVCSVVDVLIDPNSGRERYLVLGANGFFGPDVVAPSSSVWRVDDCVHLTLTCQELCALPTFDRLTSCQEAGVCSCASIRHGHRSNQGIYAYYRRRYGTPSIGAASLGA